MGLGGRGVEMAAGVGPRWDVGETSRRRAG